MSEPLDQRLSRLRRRIRQVVWLYGLSWLIAVVFGSAMLVGMIDWAIHLDDSGVRLILGLTILTAGGWIGWRFLIGPLRHQPSDVDLALRIEKKFPGFNDSLASAVEFLEKGIDPAVGSPELQRRVIEQTTKHAGRLNLSEVIETSNVRRLVAIAVAVCLTLALLVGFNQVNAGIAMNRLVFPFADVTWPRTTDLRLLDADFQPLEYDPKTPLRLARGDVLTVYVENAAELSGGKLPDDVRIEYRYSDDELVHEVLRLATRRDAAGQLREVGVATLVATRGPVWFRAVGGDDWDKPLFKLEVVPPPLIEDLQVTLTPPKYSGQPVERLPHGVGHVQGLVGTEVEVTARVNKRLMSASLQLRGRKPQPIELAGDGRRLKTRFVIADPGVYSYWFDLKDSQGFENPEAPRYEIRAVADAPPEIQIEQPAVDQYVTAVADVPLKFLVRDDLGLKSVHLHYKLGNTQDNSIQPWLLRDGDQESERPLELTVEEIWSLSDLMLSPGMRIVFHATASDDYDLGGSEHVGRSIFRTLTVITAEEKKAELASRQSELLEELERLVKAQLRAREQVGELETQLNTVGALRASDVDLLKRIELDQRQISARLLNPVDGFETKARDSLAELKLNKIDAPEMTARLQQIADEVATLRHTLLPTIEQELTRARKAANAAIGRGAENKANHNAAPADAEDDETDPAGAERNQPTRVGPMGPIGLDADRRQETITDGEEAAALERAKEHQDAVLESLAVMRGQLLQWRNRHDLLQELGELIAGQQRVRQDAAEVGRETLGRRGLEQLTPQQEANLAKVSDRQRRQADRLDEFRKTLKTQSDNEQTAPNTGNAALQDAQQHIEENATGSKMRQAADALKRNQVGIAAEGQQQIADDLDELRNILSDRGTPDSEMLVKQLKQAEQELLELRKRQEQLHKETQQAERFSDGKRREQELQLLRKQQQEVREEVARLSRRLRRLQARQAAASAGRAAERLRQTEEQLGSDEPAGAAREQQESLDDLEQAQRELAQARREAEERLARELMEQMGDKLKLMIVLQQSVIDETQRLETAHKKRGRWSRSQLSSLKQLRETQENLHRDTAALIEDMAAVEVFVLALEGASRDMKIAANRLGKRQTDRVTVAAEEAAKQRFVELVAALKPDSGSGQPPSAGGSGAQQQNPGAEGAIPKLAEFKMLKTIQEGLLRRTAKIDAHRRKNGGLSDEQQRELEEIASDQGRLADLARNLMQGINEAIELDDPPAKPSGEIQQER
jgi:hypothetical protein